MTDDRDRVERVAMALRVDWIRRNGVEDVVLPWHQQEEEERSDWLSAARAAIAAAEPPEPTDEEADRIADLCDIALQDALGAEARYDGKAFAKSLAGNGYRVVPLPPPPGDD